LRLWSIHPKYLDTQGLLALWREGLLAQKCLLGLTKGYLNHPQLIRFKRTTNPPLYIGTYLYYVYLEGTKRGYRFNSGKIRAYDLALERIPVTVGQLRYEHQHLLNKLRTRSPTHYDVIKRLRYIEPHPLFKPVPGDVEPWEKLTSSPP
jgi:hypothetical protein